MFIGNWNASGCNFAILPECLKNGQNPPPFSGTTFPIYSPSANISGTMVNNLVYDNGILLTSQTDTIIAKYLQTNGKIIWGNDGFTIHSIVNITNTAEFYILNAGNFLPFGNYDFGSLQFIITQGQKNVNLIILVGNWEPFEIYQENVYIDYTLEGRIPLGIHAITVIRNSIGEYKFYIDGISNKSTIYSTPINTIPFNDAILSDISIGNFFQTTNNNQSIDTYNIIIYNRVLSDEEVYNIYTLSADLGGLKGYTHPVNGTLQFGPKNYWIANTSGLWNNSLNWSLGIIPDSTNDIEFNENGIGHCTINNNVNMKSLIIKEGFPSSGIFGEEKVFSIYPKESGYIISAYSGFNFYGFLQFNIIPYNISNNITFDFSEIILAKTKNIGESTSNIINIIPDEISATGTKWRFLGNISGVGIQYYPTIALPSISSTIDLFSENIITFDSINILSNENLTVNISATEIRILNKDFIIGSYRNDAIFTLNAPNLQTIRMLSYVPIEDTFPYQNLSLTVSNMNYYPYDIYFESQDNKDSYVKITINNGYGMTELDLASIKSLTVNMTSNTLISNASLGFLSNLQPNNLKIKNNLNIIKGYFGYNPFGFEYTKIILEGSNSEISITQDQIANLQAKTPGQIITWETLNNSKWILPSFKPGDIGNTTSNLEWKPKTIGSRFNFAPQVDITMGKIKLTGLNNAS